MRIALVTYSTRPRGSVVHTLALAEALAALGEDVTVYAVGRGDDASGLFRPIDERVEVRIVPCAVSDDIEERVLRSIAALSRAVDPAEHDVVHAQDCIAANAVPCCVRTVHHIDHFKTPALATCHERAIVSPSELVCVSQGVAEEVIAGWGRLAQVIPNGVDAARFAAAAGPDGAWHRAAWREQLGEGPLIVTVGGIEPRKGSIGLLEAMARLRATLPSARLVIAGGETLFDYREYREAFDLRRDELGVDVEVLGPVEHERLPALVALADVFALGSVREGFGLAAMEALAAGVPVVLRDVPVLREIFDGAARFGSSGDALGDALVEALADDSPEQRRRGRELATTHTWEAAARAHVEYYEEIAGRRPLAVAA
jgi:glycosyltransferase-like protein